MESEHALRNGGPLKVIMKKADEVQLITEGIWGFL